METAESNSRVQTTCLIILATIAAALAVRCLRPALIPFVLAVFLMVCYIKWKLPRDVDLDAKHRPDEDEREDQPGQ